jgi:cytosine deaminase
VAPEQAVDELTAAATEAGLPIDLHIDESTEAQVVTLERFVSRVEHLGLGGRATASHCVSLGQQPPERARQLARHMARAGVAVVTLPQTNLYLQGRDYLTGTPRGLPPLSILEEAGVVVAAGGDNWRDLFNPLGRADPLETAALLVASGHLSAGRSYDMVSRIARTVMGLSAATIRPGDVADLLAINAPDLADAVAGATEERIVVRAGRVVARTEIDRSIAF